MGLRIEAAPPTCAEVESYTVDGWDTGIKAAKRRQESTRARRDGAAGREVAGVPEVAEHEAPSRRLALDHRLLQGSQFRPTLLIALAVATDP
jgi:hypothetical protein